MEECAGLPVRTGEQVTDDDGVLKTFWGFSVQRPDPQKAEEHPTHHSPCHIIF